MKWPTKFKLPIDLKTAAVVLLGASVVFGLIAGLIINRNGTALNQAVTGLSNLPLVGSLIPRPGGTPAQAGDKAKVEKFASKEEFLSYLDQTQQSGSSLNLSAGSAETMRAAPQAMKSDSSLGGGPTASSEPSRYSGTNVQVLGVDEPDMVKTDGKQIYYAPMFSYYGTWNQPVTMMEEDSSGVSRSKSMMPPRDTRETKVIKAFPPADLKQLGKIEKFGNLLLDKDVLVVLTDDSRSVYGYNVSKPESPEEKWQLNLEDNSYLVTARLLDGKIYLVTATNINYSDPCPFVPLKVGDESLNIPCADIYHPVPPAPTDSTFTALVVNPGNGKVESKVSFVASQGASTVYMSKSALYISYPGPDDVFKFMVDFLKTSASDLLPKELLSRLEKLAAYDISDQSKMSEFSVLLQKYDSSLSVDERVRLGSEMENRMADYSKEHMRDLGKTGIVKISLQNLKVVSSGFVSGSLLNQFSMDEYDGYLRVATTVGGSGGIWGFGSGSQTANDVYVLDGNMKIVGSVKDLGQGERIYSVRFIEDKGYVVTFRQVDPFYVLDMRNPKSPEKKGELKIPGYSSYLDPIAKDRVLGIGEEGSQVKISLFDVSDPASPKEADKYILKEYWSDVSSSHHAFLADRDKQVFFIPAGNNGYIFSYKNDRLELKKAVSEIAARRAVYVNDYLYVLGDDKIVVVNEKDWERVNELKF
ncbi:MAG: beta-propeller domain-containing protein [bacterium]|nr:beta-propeller domain-containing protein [bacterium]